MQNKLLINLVRIVITILAIGMGWGFWLFLRGGVVVVLPFMLWYIYILIGLARFKKWAFELFIFIVSLALFIEALFIILGGVKERFFDLFLILMVIVSSIGIIVAGAVALVRKFSIGNRIRKENSRETLPNSR